MGCILECRQVRRTFGQGPLAEEVLRGVSVAVRAGETCVLIGPSGSGKTTLLSILGCLLSPTSGEIWIEGRTVDHRCRGELSRLRRDKIGFVFQHGQLLPFLSLAENLEVVGRNAGLSGPLSSGAVRCVYVGSNAVLSGFTLTNGYATRDTISDIYGGGTYGEQSAVVTNCILSGNSAAMGGGAFGGTLNNCLLTRNSGALDSYGGGGAFQATLNNCLIISTSASGGGGGEMSCWDATRPYEILGPLGARVWASS